jgi:hypothetical protein
MNVNTGQIYRTQSDIDAAIERGEPIIPLTEEQANRLSAQTPDSRRKTPEDIEKLRREYAALKENS